MENLAADVCRLGNSVFAVIGRDGLTNFGLIKGADGSAVLVDADIRRMDEIEQALKKVGCARVRYLFNTHENFDHTSANHYFEKNGAIVIGSDGTFRALKEDGEAKFAEMAGRSPELQARFPDLKMGLTQVSFAETATLYLSDVTVRLTYGAYHGKSHSRGDAVAYVEEEKILFAGDLLYSEVHPVTIYGNIPNWLQSIDILSNHPFETVVPGHGPVAPGTATGKKALQTFRAYLEDFHQQLLLARSGGKSAEDVHAHMTAERYRHLGKTWMVKRNIGYFLKGAD